MEVKRYQGDEETFPWSRSYLDSDVDLPANEQLRFFYLDKGGAEPSACALLPIDSVETREGRICALTSKDQRYVLGCKVCTYYGCDNNGAGYKERADYATLVCGERLAMDWYRVEGDTLHIVGEQPKFPYASENEERVRPWDGITVRHVVVEGSVRELNKYILQGSESLEDVVVEEGVEKIGDCAFQDCEHLERVSIPKSVRDIGYRPLGNCQALRRVTIKAAIKADSDCIPCRFDGMPVIVCRKGGPVERFARKRGNKVEYLPR